MPGMRSCQCGRTTTTAPLTRCKPCETCGRMLHNQYEILYHPHCEKETNAKETRMDRPRRAAKRGQY